MAYIDVRFYYQGEFQTTQYSGGQTLVIKDVEVDRFSYPVLMEYVKDDLEYTEIGGVYVRKGNKQGGWQLVANDPDLLSIIEGVKDGEEVDFYVDNVVDNTIEPIKQMQPHVTIRPRKNIVAAKKQVKRKFVTTHQLQQQQMMKKANQCDKPEKRNTKMLPQVGTRKSPRLNKMQETTDHSVLEMPASVKRKLDLGGPEEDEIMGENEPEELNLPPPPPLTDYEKQRLITVKRNNEVFFALNLPTLSAEVRASMSKGKSKKDQVQQGSDEEYDPSVDIQAASKDGGSGTQVKRRQAEKTKALIGRGPTTRSRFNSGTSKKQAAEDLTRENDQQVLNVKPGEPPIQLPAHVEAKGSMEAFWAMRKRQKEAAAGKASTTTTATTKASTENVVPEENILPDIEEEEEPDPVPRRMRGQTRMDRVHTRSIDQRIVLEMNERKQPVSDDDKTLSELSNFLGTLAKRCVSLTFVSWRDVPLTLKDTMWNYVRQRYIIPDDCKSWVLQTIQSSWRTRKSRIKKAHYLTFQTDEERIENRPDEIPLESFKMLLEYWNDESVQRRAEKNARSRSEYTDTHTVGPKSFAQIRNKMKKKRSDDSAPPDSEVFMETRARADGREYKTDSKVIKNKIQKIKEKIITAEDPSGELLSDGKKHGQYWLQGRCAKTTKGCGGSTNTYVQELAGKIKENLATEIEASVSKKVQEVVEKKVQEKMSMVLKKLAYTNPGITINLEELYPTSDHDENFTPITGGSTF